MADSALVLATLPLVAAAIVRRRAELDSSDSEIGLPRPLLQYFFETAQGTRDQGQLAVLFDLALDSEGNPTSALASVAGWLLRFSWYGLGWHRIRELGRNTWSSPSPEADYAAKALLGSSAERLGYLWHADASGRDWLHLWSASGTRDAEVLEHAGLHAAELALLQAAVTAVN